jgi:outer membrane protein TolC
MKKILFVTIYLFCTSSLYSQGVTDSIVSQILQNNKTLEAYRKTADAEKIGNKTGIYLSNPEVEFNYLWGSPSVIGNRTDVSVRQSFDFPTAYRYRSQISNLRNEQAELNYQKQRKEILLQARLICVELTSNLARRKELSARLGNASKIADSYQAKFKNGEANVLEFNKAQLILLNLTKVKETLDIEGKELASQLALLNGGNSIDFTDSEFQPLSIPADFEQWYANAEGANPVLQRLKQEIEVLQKQEKLNLAQSLPKFQAGYMSEKVVGQQFQGVTVGVSIPLWENKNTVRHVQAQAAAAQSLQADQKLHFYNNLKALYSRAVGLQKNLKDYREKLQECNNSDLVLKALDKGEISLLEYLFELTVYYESVDQLIETERNLHRTWVELNQYR